ncbi:hypothetical protein ACPVPU_03380 [Sphingomonas sp. CJ99]
MMRGSMAMMVLAFAALAGCGGGTGGDPVAEGNAASAPAKASAAAEGGGETIPATREQVEQAWQCRGLIAAAFAAKTILSDDRPAELDQITATSASYWTDRAARLKAPDMTDADENAAIAKGTRVLATRDAIERELPAIRECLAAQQAG